MFHLDLIEKRAATAQITAAIAASAGAKDVTFPDPDALRTEYDDWLNTTPGPVDVEKRELMRALGVAE